MALVRKAVLGILTAAALHSAAGPTTPDSVPARPHFDGTGLRSTQLVYETTLERDSGTTQLGTRTVSALIASYAGAPAWLFTEMRSGDGVAAFDTVFSDVSTLKPLHWSSTLGAARLALEFRGDTVFGATSSPPGRRSIIAGIPPSTIVSSSMLEMVLRVAPLSYTWEDSASVMSITVSGNTVLPARLAVIGEDRVRVPAGTFDCWVVSVRADPARGLYWVTKRDPIVVRSAVDVPALGSAQLVSALTRIGR